MLASTPSVNPAQSQVLSNLRSERIGGHTVADLNPPDEFLRRVADRILRGSFEARFRAVVGTGPGGVMRAEPAPGTAFPTPGIRVVDGTLGALCPAWQEGRPERRGFRPDDGGAMELPDLGPADRGAAELVAKRLAVEGLLSTLSRVIVVLGAGEFSDTGDAQLTRLRELGLPVDLLAYFGPSPAAVVSRVAGLVAGGQSISGRALAALPFAPAQSVKGFCALDEGGSEPLASARVQVTSDQYWSGPGDGSCLDLLRQLALGAPEMSIVAGIERKHLQGFLHHAASWGLAPAAWLVLPQDRAVSQWAQDNAKAGRDAAGAVLLLPRFPSRGEVGATFVPGEWEATERLSLAGVRTARSALLFQGGNLLLARVRGERVLLIGEAEIWRNSALGLTAAQAEQALRVEFGADRSVVLPATAFHIDYEVSVRMIGDKAFGFVNDSAGAARIVLSCAVDALAAGGAMSVQAARDAGGALAANRDRDALALISEVLSRAAVGRGQLPESFASIFARTPADHGPSNLQCVLLAMDVLAAGLGAPADGPVREYLDAVRRRETDRKVLRRRLADAGIEVVHIPGFAEEHRGANPLNGLHRPGSYLMPSYGGMLEPLDAAAAAGFARVMGSGVRVVRIACAETQRRAGAVRCAVAPMAVTT